MNLKDKNIIVTGGCQGIGYQIVKSLANEGAHVGIFDKDISNFDSKDIKKSENIFLLDCNVADRNNLKNAINKYIDKFDKIDVLINNAGIIHNEPLFRIEDGKLIKHDLKTWHKVLSNDLESVFITTMEVVEKMILNRTKGVIVNISSISAKGNAGQSAYSAAKAGVNALTRLWAKELGPWGIRVVAIAPGFCDTKSTQDIMEAELLNNIKKQTPIKRLGNPAEIASGVISILSNDYINGKIIEIDGGLTI